MAGFLSNVPILNALTGSGPTAQQVPLDPQTAGLIHQDVTSAANQTPDMIAAGNNAAAAKGAAGFADATPDQGANSAAGSGSDPSMVQAIRNQYGQIAGKGMDQIKRQNSMQASSIQAQQMSQFAKTALAQQQVQTQNFEALSQSYQQNEMARSQMISSLIDLGTTAYAMNAKGAKKSNGPTESLDNQSSFHAGASNAQQGIW